MIQGAQKRRDSFRRLPVRFITHTHLLRWTGVFHGFLAARCRFVPHAKCSWIIIEHLAGEKGKRHCLPNASIMIHRKPRLGTVIRSKLILRL